MNDCKHDCTSTEMRRTGWSVICGLCDKELHATYASLRSVAEHAEKAYHVGMGVAQENRTQCEGVTRYKLTGKGLSSSPSIVSIRDLASTIAKATVNEPSTHITVSKVRYCTTCDREL